MRGVGGGVGVIAGKKGLGVCRMKAPSVLRGVKGIIMQTMGEGTEQGICESHVKKQKQKREQMNAYCETCLSKY